MPDLATIENLPVSLQELEAFVSQYNAFNPFEFRVETIKRIEKITGNVLLCYVSQITFLPSDLPLNRAGITDNDVEGFDQLIDTALAHSSNKRADIFLVSNGGSPETAERIVRLLRENFQTIRFVIPSNAFSAATMMSFACDSIIMSDAATLGPIDPQVGGIPARSILRGFEDLERRLKVEGPEALTAYMDLLKDYSLHLLEICKSAEALAKELAAKWLSQYMLRCGQDDSRVQTIVDYFANYDTHKSHSRSIGRQQAVELGLVVEKLERGTPLDRLVRSLHAQYLLFFRGTPFYKVYENAYGTGYGCRWPETPIIQAQ